MTTRPGSTPGGSRPDTRVTARAGARHRHTSTRRGRHVLRGVASVVVALFSATLLCGFGYGWYQYRTLTGGLHGLSISSLGHDDDVTRHTGTEMNILVTGIDSRTGLSASERHLLHVGSDISMSTDTIMIIHVPANGRRATLISIPRDSYVAIPGFLNNKINAAFADGYTNATGTESQKQAAGADLLTKTVENLTGLSIDHYMQVGFGGFYTITKAIGSLPVTLCHSVDDTTAYNIAHGEGSVGSGFKMSAGYHDLTPLQAFEFVRQRHNLAGGDLARERRQQYFLAAAFRKMTSGGVLLNPGKLHNLIEAIDGAVYLDNDLAAHLTTLAQQFVDLSAGNITGYTIPDQGNGTEDIAGTTEDVLEIDQAQVQQQLKLVLDGGSATPAAGSASSSTSSSPPDDSSTAASSSAGTPAATTTTPAAPTAQKCID